MKPSKNHVVQVNSRNMEVLWYYICDEIYMINLKRALEKNEEIFFENKGRGAKIEVEYGLDERQREIILQCGRLNYI